MGYDIDYRTHSDAAVKTVGEDNPLPTRQYDGAGNPLVPAQEGAPITGQALEAGGSHTLGWLSSVRKAVTDRLGVLGQALMAASTPVVIASDQSAVAGKVADGADVAIGTTTDAAKTSDTSGTVIGFLRGVVKMLADVWDAAHHGLQSVLMLNGGSSSLGATTAMPADGDANTQAHLQYVGVGTLRYYVRQLLYNGLGWDLTRNNVSTTLLASASRTTTAAGTSADQVSYNGRRLVLIVNVSDASGGGSITPSLQVKDSVSGNYFTVWTAAAALVGAGTSAYLFADGAAGGSWTEKLAFGVPGRVFRLVCTANNASALIYSASLELMI